MYLLTQSLALLLGLPLVLTKCYEPSPAFPVPLWTTGTKRLDVALQAIERKLNHAVADDKYAKSSFSVEITSNTDTLWSHFHTARQLNTTRPGTTKVDGDSLYRIASITKTFTVLGILHQQKAGNLSLDDTVDKYLSELADPDSGALPWGDITLRILASQLSGIPREFAQSDLINELADPTEVGLPPASKKGLPQCDEYKDFIPCGKKDLFHRLANLTPLFAPNQKSTYSNLNFELLGLVLENVTGIRYADYIDQAIFQPLEMTSSSLTRPDSDHHAVLPAIGFNYWDVEEGVQGPTGGIYSSSSDMSKFVRYALTHFNTLATGVNWVMPASWSTGLNSFYGMPWEIFRTDAILKESKRPVTFVTKSGGLPGYYSRISIMEEYGLGLTVLVGGSSELASEIQEIVTVGLIQAAEEAVWAEIGKTYDGSYVSTDSSVNSSLELSSSPSTGLKLESFISNGVDVFQALLRDFAGGNEISAEHPWHAQLIPTLLYKNETAQEGEVWKIAVVSERREGAHRAVWDDFCTTDIEGPTYAGIPINEVVFWHEEALIELPAWKTKMRLAKDRGEDLGLVVQV